MRPRYSSGMFVRRFAEPDTPALYDVCLRTADVGGDATHLHDEPSLPGHVWLGPYLALEPDLAWVVDDGNGRPLGYIVGALDTLAFEESRERSWWPDLRALYPESSDRSDTLTTADEDLIRTIHHPHPPQSRAPRGSSVAPPHRPPAARRRGPGSVGC